MKYNILVPVDFTEISNNAVKYAIGAAKLLNTGIALLHILEKNETEQSATEKINNLIGQFSYTNVPLKGMVKAGNIYDDIGATAAELQSGLIFMGTHGLMGMQYVMGSRALKVVTNSSVPFIITQNSPPINDDINSIVMPIDMGVEEKQILTAVVEAAETFVAKVHLFVSKHNDEFLENAVKRNLAFSKKYLAEHNVSYSTTIASGEKDFGDQLIDFANSIDADMIAIVNHKDDGIKNLFGASFDQNVITNKHNIPVLIMNTKDISTVGDIFQVFR